MSSVKNFVRFARQIGVTDGQMFPAHDSVIEAYIGYNVGKIKSSSMSNIISGLKWFHTTNGLEWLGTPRIEKIIKGLDNLAPPESWKAPRKPITLEMLLCLCENLNRSPLHVAVRAIALCAFFGQMRLGEPLPEDAKLTNDKMHPKWRDVTFYDRCTSASIFLPWSKTAKWNREEIMLARQSAPLNPAAALYAHFQISGRTLGEEANLFHFVSTKPQPGILDKKLFMAVCNEIWTSHGFETYTGHSFRIGGTTTFLLAGVDPNVVQKSGRWASDAFLKYWRNNKKIVAQHLSDIKIPTYKEGRA
jgi:hypothetical protein